MPTLAGWTASPGLFLPGLRRRDRLEPWRGPAEPLEHTATEGKGGLPSPIRQQPIMADTLEARGEHMEELCGALNYVARMIQRSILP